MKKLKNKIIKWLGGYTEKEYLRVERKYQGLLDSKSGNETARVCNEYLSRALLTLDRFAKEDLYGTYATEWSRRMYNVIHNNYLRILIRYVHVGSGSLYSIDTTLDEDDQFQRIIREEGGGSEEEYPFILETD